MKYLDNLPLTPEQKQLVAVEGYENAATLYMLCRVTPTAIRELLGLESLIDLDRALWAAMTPEEQAAVEKELEASR